MMVLALHCAVLVAVTFSSTLGQYQLFYPKAEGTALGLNANLGNLGVSGGAVCGAVGDYCRRVRRLGRQQNLGERRCDQTTMWLQNAGFVWVPFIIIATITGSA